MNSLPLVHDRAKADVQEIAAHIAMDQLLAAIRFCDAAQSSFDLLAQFPGLGPEWTPVIEEFPIYGLGRSKDSEIF